MRMGFTESLKQHSFVLSTRLLTFFSLLFLFLAALGFCGCAQVFSSCGERGLLSSSYMRASHCSGFTCCGARALDHRLSSHGSWA